MNTKISIHILAEALASRSGKDAATCEKFIKELFGTVTEGLENNEPVHIPGLGVFSRSVSETEPVSFVPDTIFSETVNAPFAIFQPEELNDDVTEELLDSVVSENEQYEQDEQQYESSSAQQSVITEKEEKLPMVEAHVDYPVDIVQEPIVIETPAASVVTETDAMSDEPVTDSESVNNESVAEYLEETIESVPETSATIAVEEPVGHEPIIDDTPAEAKEEEVIAETESSYDNNTEYEQEPKSSSGFKSGFITGLIVGIALGAMAVFMFVMLTANDTTVSDEESDNSMYIESTE